MRSPDMTEARLHRWQRVRAYAVPPTMIESATARRLVGDWAGACAAARVDVDLRLRDVGRARGRDLTARMRADLRHLAPDLLRWHMPRIAPDGLLRPGLTISLARYRTPEWEDPVHLVVRTPPAWADAGQRMSLAVWSGDESPPDRRYRLDLHRHLWDVRRSGELRSRPGGPDGWPAEAEILLRADGRTSGTVAIRVGGGHRRLVHVGDPAPAGHRLPVLPDAATWVQPDVTLLDAGAITPDRLHPLVAAALRPGTAPGGPKRAERSRMVDCRGARHRIGIVDGVLTPLDHDPAELRREELLAALSGAPLPCLRVIDQAHRSPECLPEVRARLDHGDVAGALSTVEALLGPEAVLRAGSLHAELATAARRRIVHGLFRAGLTGRVPHGPDGHVPVRR